MIYLFNKILDNVPATDKISIHADLWSEFYVPNLKNIRTNLSKNLFFSLQKTKLFVKNF